MSFFIFMSMANNGPVFSTHMIGMSMERHDGMIMTGENRKTATS
jgi:hypothetical protein